jgi:hypothetical protein
MTDGRRALLTPRHEFACAERIDEYDRVRVRTAEPRRTGGERPMDERERQDR